MWFCRDSCLKTDRQRILRGYVGFPHISNYLFVFCLGQFLGGMLCCFKSSVMAVAKDDGYVKS